MLILSLEVERPLKKSLFQPNKWFYYGGDYERFIKSKYPATSHAGRVGGDGKWLVMVAGGADAPLLVSEVVLKTVLFRSSVGGVSLAVELKQNKLQKKFLYWSRVIVGKGELSGYQTASVFKVILQLRGQVEGLIEEDSRRIFGFSFVFPASGGSWGYVDT